MFLNMNIEQIDEFAALFLLDPHAADVLHVLLMFVRVSSERVVGAALESLAASLFQSNSSPD